MFYFIPYILFESDKFTEMLLESQLIEMIGEKWRTIAFRMKNAKWYLKDYKELAI